MGNFVNVLVLVHVAAVGFWIFATCKEKRTTDRIFGKNTKTN
jgi:hypothetical protein